MMRLRCGRWRSLLLMPALAAPSALLRAQAAQLVQGSNLGSSSVRGLGDVDDDGFGDYLVDLGASWRAVSGATGQPLLHLAQNRSATDDLYGGLRADLDVDGCDDLFFASRAAGQVEFRSGRNGTPLFSIARPDLAAVLLAADHDGDGADDASFVRPYRRPAPVSWRGSAMPMAMASSTSPSWSSAFRRRSTRSPPAPITSA